MRTDLLKPVLLCLWLGGITISPSHGETLPGFQPGPHFGEQILTGTVAGDVRFSINAAGSFDPKLPTEVVFYATPNGNSVAETLGRRPRSPAEWHYDIQHVAAQIRRLREIRTAKNIVLICLEAPGRSWPSWCSRRPDADAVIRRIVEDMMGRFPGRNTYAVLMGHSGGGSFSLGFLDSAERVPDYVERIAFLDANYSYSDERSHGDKLLTWLHGGAARRLVVLAYDDRSVTLGGKPVVSADGGTYRATHRMIDRLGKDRPLTASAWRDFDVFTDKESQIGCFINRNYDNRILHTVLVGDMNGVLQALTFGTEDSKRWGVFGGQRAYTRWIEPADDAVTPDTIPPRPTQAETGAAFMRRIAAQGAVDPEAEILHAITGGNIPDFLRCFRRVTIRGPDAGGVEHTVSLDVAPDYLSVGSDSDFYRIPMTPATAGAVAGRFGCTLPTTRIVDEIYRAAEVKLAPRPLTEEREAVTTFVQHNAIIEEQRANIPCGPIVAGIKKDIVITNRLLERPDRVAIYGWHRLDGKPIQPLSTVHLDTYVDYSHGVRLVSRRILLDGKETDLLHVLRDANLARLLSDEGPIREKK